MKRSTSIDKIVSKGKSNKKAKLSPIALPVVNKATSAYQPIMDQILNNEGLQHIAEIIFLNLDSEKIKPTNFGESYVLAQEIERLIKRI